jgi:hypothetical protein
LRNGSGSFAKLVATRGASSRVSILVIAAERLSRDSAELLNKDSVDVGVDTYYKRVGTCYFARRIRQFR